jgi:hypothetical protein
MSTGFRFSACVLRCAAIVLATTSTFFASVMVLAAEPLTGIKTVTLHDGASERHEIATIKFEPASEGTRFTVTLKADRFGEYFLAMRPFKCLVGSRQHLCHFPFERAGSIITETDLQPLEYTLMFLHKKPATVSLDSRNGLYYTLKRNAKGDGFEGRVHDVDMDPIIVPSGVPEARRTRPIRRDDLNTADPSAYWLPFISVE